MNFPSIPSDEFERYNQMAQEMSDEDAIASYQYCKRNLISQDVIYKDLLRRRYRNPKRYPTWEDIALDLAAEIVMGDTEQWQRIDSPKQQCIIKTRMFELTQGPVYWCDRELLDSLMQTETPNIELRELFKAAVFILPDGWLKDPDGHPVDYLVVNQILPNEKIPNIPIGRRAYPQTVVAETLPTHRISVHTTIPTGASYWKAFEILGDRPILDVEAGSSYNATPAESEFNTAFSKLAYQLMLVLQEMPDMIAEVDEVPRKKKQRRKETKKGMNFLPVRWIGKGFKTQRSQSPGAGSHASPRAHWRVGHWRRVAVGKGRKERETRWIRPTMVNWDA